MKAKFMGAVYGSIIGDIIGSFNEFTIPGSKKGRGTRKITNKMLHRERSVFGYKFGYFTDDTTMSLILMKSLIKFDEVHEYQMMWEFREWWQNGYMSSADECFDIGGQTLRSIKKYFNIPDHRNTFADTRGDGNGALMRIFPIGLRFYNDRQMRVQQTIRAHDLTHESSTLSLQRCLLLNEAIAGSMNGQTKEEILEILGYTFEMDENISTSGFVVDTYDAVVHTFKKFDNLMDGIVYLAEMGDDSDTCAAIYGALAGAFYGVSQVPQWMMNEIRRKTLIRDLAENLYGRTVKMSGKGSRSI
jgi:ADP-ribosyl-[dinitrogen reductase] hydrolase